ncbi:hypothetical protein O3M35_000680 [Rhynocoris fuscipes]|uniref:Major facilitator superfamily (MFS) profile domain-containing protein n=1 Tax=Rhynocoris fuscipes TaxID=488301 RepID=A0AAW1DMH5_9HEMI
MVKTGVFGVRHIQCFLLLLSYSTFTMQVVGAKLTLMLMAASNKGTSGTIGKDESLQIMFGSLRGNALDFIEHPMKTILSFSAGIWSVNRRVKYLILGLGLYGTISSYTINLFIRVYGWQVLLMHEIVLLILKSMADPLLYSLIAKWVPTNEQGKLVQLIFPGQLLGALLEYTIGYYLGKPQEEWIQVLIWAGNCSVLWAIAWAAFAADHPKTCFYIERTERQYIQEHLRNTAKYGVEKKIPWSKIFLTPELYPIIFTHSCVIWAQETGYLCLNSYFSFVHKQDLNLIAPMLGYSHLSALIIALPIGIVVDLLVSKKVQLSRIRNVITCIGMWGAAAAIVLMGQAPTVLFAQVMAGFYITFTTPLYVGVYLNYLDFSPNFAGLLFGIGSAIAYFIAIGVPLVRNALVQHDDRIGWNQFMYTSALANYLGGLVYSLYSSTKIQPFNTLSAQKGIGTDV